MKRLEIVLIGHSLTLGELSTELQDHGHGVRYLREQHALPGLTLPDACILIEDGSLDLSPIQPQAYGRCVHLSLRVGFDSILAFGLPRLELLCWHGSVKAQRLIVREWLPSEASGNGRELRDRAIARLVDLIALQVSRLSRDDDYFTSVPKTRLPRAIASVVCRRWISCCLNTV